mmetsp:Transcript_2498/g.5798  ORF Transcript_2498/g.5798 Transcript_2498/m.5798 type:complete len:106 (-) Transcript_2498:32-349(-)
MGVSDASVSSSTATSAASPFTVEYNSFLLFANACCETIVDEVSTRAKIGVRDATSGAMNASDVLPNRTADDSTAANALREKRMLIGEWYLQMWCLGVALSLRTED